MDNSLHPSGNQRFPVHGNLYFETTLQILTTHETTDDSFAALSTARQRL